MPSHPRLVCRFRRSVRNRGQQIDVRFVRGDRWLAGRLATLSSKSAYVITTAPLRVGDCGAHCFGVPGTLVRWSPGTVQHVTTPHDALQAGIGGFSVVFNDLQGTARKELVTLLRAAAKRWCSAAAAATPGLQCGFLLPGRFA